QTDERTITLEDQRVIQPAIGCAGLKQDYFADFIDWFTEYIIGQIGSGVGPDRINQLYLAGVKPPSQSFEEKELRTPVKQNIENYFDENLPNLEIQEWLTEPAIEIREREYREAPASVHERPDLIGLAQLHE
ncbi:MAG: hypothetical protein ABEI13_03285, partial [Candidatus Paceibacteria bacterium]